MRPLDPLRVPLKGLRLVEASAGTGKTFTIALLYLRLLIEGRLGPDEILVVTYTRAATAELKGRIRNRIEEALELAEGRGAPDPLLGSILEGHSDAANLLRAALLNFDRARISTIHGFAQRVLQESAFETGQPFEFDVTEDDRDRLSTVVTDFWTRTFYDMPMAEARLVLSRFGLPAALRFSREVMRRRDAPMISSGGESADLDDVLGTWSRAKEHALRHFDPEFVRNTLAGLNRQRYTARRVTEWLESVPRVEPHTVKVEMLELLRAGGLATRKGQPEPRHPFFDAMAEWHRAHERLTETVNARIMALRSALAAFVVEQSMQERDRTRGFDDLLRELDAACAGPRGEALVSGLRRTYRAALIDEFQDTDPLQYRIFARVFDGLPLFLIGDPKQAIYGFRGADVFAYFTAARVADDRYSMSVNYRSSPDIVAATDRLFSSREDAFVLPQLRFQPVEAAGERGSGVEGDPLGNTALTFLLHRSDKAAPKSEARQLSVETTARVIANALTSPMRIDGRAVQASDFAVLSRTNDFAQAVQSALRRRGVPAVFRGDKSVFFTAAAAELHRVLAAMLEPSAQGLLRGALLSGLAGVRADSLVADDGTLLVKHAGRFAELRRRWAERGFMDAFRGFVAAYGVEARLLAQAEGERALTDLLHVAELLHRAEHERALGPARLSDWFTRARQDPDGSGYSADATTQMRLETDEPAVELFTIHTAKGLEFPLVVCPELWNASFAPSPKPGPIAFHREDALTLDLSDSPDPENLEAATQEWRAENLRLLYVALTRAVHRIYVPWGNFSGADASALAYLLGGTEVLPVLGGPVGALDASTISDTRVSVPSRTAKASKARAFSGRVPIERGTTSYSAWVADANEHHFAERDIDAQQPQPDSTGATLLLPSLPPGASTGQLVHTVLERMDLRAPDPEIVARVLAEFGSPPWWQDEIDAMVNAVRRSPLQLADPVRHSLSEMDAGQPELEFILPLRPQPRWQEILTDALLAEGGVFEHYAPRFADLEVRQVAGYLRGFIDWIGEVQGYGVVVDYKSNLLHDYGPAALESAMLDHHYMLQAVVYAVALRRQLAAHRRALPLGGAHYLFLRGLDGDGRGAFALHPSPELLEAFEFALLGGPS
ncbi:MAG: UvrD-helicase domain-containing protein [Myxococcota bacterium]